jgi:adenylate cyclase class 2
MNLFGYKEGVTVEKTRRTCTHKDYTITLDEVLGLGNFIEIEKVVFDGDAQKIQDEMFTFAKNILDLEKDEKVMKGYDILTYYKNNLG